MEEEIRRLRKLQIEQDHKLKQLTRLIFENIEHLNIIKNDYVQRYHFDMAFELNTKQYLVNIKKVLHFDTKKRREIIEKYKEVKELGYNVIMIIFGKNINFLDLQEFRAVATILDISNILYIIKDNPYLINRLTGILDYSIENIKPNKPEIDLVLNKEAIWDDDTEEDYNKQLHSIIPGRNTCITYQKYCVEVLQYLFLDKLDLWNDQLKSDNGLNIFDLICKIKSKVKDEFYSTIEEFFQTKYVVFEFKNYQEPITQKEICLTEKYLDPTALRNVAIIISRKGADTNADLMIKGILRDSGKLILVLNDKDMKNMIDKKNNGEEPSQILIDKLDNLLIHIEK